MRNTNKLLVLLAVIGLSSNFTFARNNLSSSSKPVLPASHYKTEVADCPIPRSQIDLNINNVRAKLLNAGDMWWDGISDAKYEVPKGDGNTPRLHAVFAGSIWVSGLDAGGALHIAATKYRNDGVDFYAGPLDDRSGTVTRSVCDLWDKQGYGHFVVFGDSIREFQRAYRENGNTIPIDVLNKNVGIKYWPGKGNAYLQSSGYDMSINLAPFYDRNSNGVYEPENGDYPRVGFDKCEPNNPSFADQMIFWVTNDMGNTHSQTSGQPMGIQINNLAFAFKTTDDINNMTFYRYTIENKSNNTYDSVYMSQWIDPDLGCYKNDYIGCDTARSLGYVYNGVANDGGVSSECASGQAGYGTQLPMLGVDYFEGPTDEFDNELGMSSFIYFNNCASGQQCDPNTAQQFRNFQEGKWAFGNRTITLWGNGYQASGGTPTKYAYSGNPSDANSWSECHTAQGTNTANPVDDRRFLQSSGPFKLLPRSPKNITVGLVFVRPEGGVGTCPDVKRYLGPADDEAQKLFDRCFELVDGPDAPDLNITELSNEIIIRLENKESSNNVGESYFKKLKDFFTNPSFPTTNVKPEDSAYVFQGYKVYQLKDDKVSATDLNDISKARLLAQFDLKDGITQLVNWKFDDILKVYIPTIEIKGEDKGIQHSIRVIENLFAEGSDKKLINNTTYYYGAVAYAYNNFREFNPNNGSGQLITYKEGSKNFNRYSAIPHSVDGEQQTLNAKYGDGTVVKRIEGKNNGGNYLQVNPSSYDQLFSGNTDVIDQIEYAPGGDPIGFKVTDPLKLKEADFEVKVYEPNMRRDSTNLLGEVRKTAYWELHDLTNNRIVASDRNIDRDRYEQLMSYKNPNGSVEDYGFSLNLGIPFVVDSNVQFSKNMSVPVYAPIGGKIIYSNVENQWLKFVKDNGAKDPLNWIRSGPLVSNTEPGNIWGDNFYQKTASILIPHDANRNFSTIADGMWAPYCLTSNYYKDAFTPGEDRRVYGPGFKWKKYVGSSPNADPPKNNLDKLQSVDIVFTPDKSKWSRCVVFETNDIQDENEGATLLPSGKGARKGMIRMHYSVDKDYTYTDTDTGRGWFPGYAVNVETGERLNVAFGESSNLVGHHGNDMIWNPTSTVLADYIAGDATVPEGVFGGRHFIYVMSSKYDEGAAMQRVLLDNANAMSTQTTSDYPVPIKSLYDEIMYSAIPYIAPNVAVNSNDVKVEIRVGRPYGQFATSQTASTSDSISRYWFSTKGMGPKDFTKEQTKTALDDIRIVPNPYLAYSAYERASTDYRVKITHLPKSCKIRIFTVDGQLVKLLNRSVGSNIVIEGGRNIDNPSDNINYDDAIEWDLKNDKGIPVASGVYLFEVEAPGIGTKVLRFFGALRPADVSTF